MPKNKIMKNTIYRTKADEAWNGLTAEPLAFTAKTRSSRMARVTYENEIAIPKDIWWKEAAW